MRRFVRAGPTIAVGVSRSTIPTPSYSRRKPTGSPSGSREGEPAPTASAESVLTGPPWNSTSGEPASAPQSGRISSTGTCEGRLSTTPSAPSSSASRTSTTLRSKLGSSSIGVATRRSPTVTWGSVGSDIRGGDLRGALGGGSHRGGDGGVHLGMEDAGDDVVRVQLALGDRGGDGLGGGDQQGVGDRVRRGVQQSAEHSGEGQHVVDLVRVVRPPGGHHARVLACHRG